jgi:hypothetical protein
MHRAGLELREIEELREQSFERLDRGADARHEGPHVGIARLGGERRRKSPTACSG